MAVLIAFVAVQAALIILLAPVKIGLKGHFSLQSERMFVDVSLDGVRAVRMRAGVKDGKLLFTLNDEPLKLKGAFDLKSAFKEIKRLKICWNAAVYASVSDAKNAAMLCAFSRCLGDGVRLYPSEGEERFYADVNAFVKTNVMELLGAAIRLSGASRKKK